MMIVLSGLIYYTPRSGMIFALVATECQLANSDTIQISAIKILRTNRNLA